MGSALEGEEFFASRWPEARAVSDPDKKLYAAFGLARGGLLQVAGPAVWGRGLRALLSGHGVGKPIGDPLQLSGHFVIRDRAIVWRDVHQQSGAEIRWNEIWAAATE